MAKGMGGCTLGNFCFVDTLSNRLLYMSRVQVVSSSFIGLRDNRYGFGRKQLLPDKFLCSMRRFSLEGAKHECAVIIGCHILLM